jgi:MFS transporter, SP family, general alpha glucoside:H+ symporter
MGEKPTLTRQDEESRPHVDTVEDGVQPVSSVPEDIDGHNDKSNIIAFAKSASDKEHKMTLVQGIRLYPKAIAWSMLISTCIAMEGYDISLVNNFCTLKSVGQLVIMQPC